MLIGAGSMSSLHPTCNGCEPAKHIRCGTSFFAITACGPASFASGIPVSELCCAGWRRDYLDRTGYGPHPSGVAVTFEYLRSRVETVEFIGELLRASATRSPRMNCFGMHEWAMVYRAPTVRHGQVPLRLTAAETDAVVESMPLRCTHFDAFRFFTEPAAAMNAGTPSRRDQTGWEQPGCVHANMDLYKWCYKLGPLIESELLFDCLELAADARALDMRASPYDLRDHGFEPIAIETPAGRAAYIRSQQDIASRAAPLRVAIADRCDELLVAAMAAIGN